MGNSTVWHCRWCGEWHDGGCPKMAGSESPPEPSPAPTLEQIVEATLDVREIGATKTGSERRKGIIAAVRRQLDMAGPSSSGVPAPITDPADMDRMGPDDQEAAACASSEPCSDGAIGRHAPSPVENRDSGAIPSASSGAESGTTSSATCRHVLNRETLLCMHCGTDLKAFLIYPSSSGVEPLGDLRDLHMNFKHERMPGVEPRACYNTCIRCQLNAALASVEALVTRLTNERNQWKRIAYDDMQMIQRARAALSGVPAAPPQEGPPTAGEKHSCP